LTLKIKPQTDIKNQERTNQPEQNEEMKLMVNKTNRRYQQLGTEAPVSNRNYKKRKVALEGHQTSKDTNTASPKNNPMVQT